jgi:hypothetical protein
MNFAEVEYWNIQFRQRNTFGMMNLNLLEYKRGTIIR